MFHGTTILSVRRDNKVAIAGDGQITMGNTVMKRNAKKIRRMYNDKMLAGFAGTTADALTLFEKFEGKLEKYRGNITRAAVELAKDWRTDRVLRRLEALLAVVDTEHSFYNIRQWRRNRARGRHNSNRLWRTLCPCSSKGASSHTSLNAKEIVQEAMKLAAEICIYTNQEITVDEL